jgi:hypothetical protein
VLFEKGVDRKNAQRLVAEGSFNSLSRIMAAVISNPFKGLRKAQSLAEKLQRYRLYHRLYHNLEMNPPTVEQYIDCAQHQLTGSRLSFLLGSQENY